MLTLALKRHHRIHRARDMTTGEMAMAAILTNVEGARHERHRQKSQTQRRATLQHMTPLDMHFHERCGGGKGETRDTTYDGMVGVIDDGR